MKIDKDAIAHLADCSIAQLTKVYDSILKVSNISYTSCVSIYICLYILNVIYHVVLGLENRRFKQ